MRQPDTRLLVTRIFDVLNFIPKSPEKLLAEVWLDWGTADDDFPECRLTKQFVSGQDGPFRHPCDEPPILTRVYDQIHETEETPVGEPDVSFDQYGRKTIVLHFIQFSAGTPIYETVGTTPCPDDATCILKTQVDTDDGTLRTITRTYIDSGEMADDYSLNFGGNLIIRTITSLNEVPATPAGYTLFGPGVEYVEGLPLYRYRFSAVNGGGVPGQAAEIGRSYYNAQGGTVNFNPASPTSADGTVKQVIEYITAQTVTANPIPTPSGFVLVGIDSQQAEGYKKWTGTYYRASGIVVDEKSISESGALVTYHRVSYGTAPIAPAATIGGTVTLFQDDTAQQDGYVRYERRWAEGNGQSDYTVEGESDGSLTYTVVEYDAAAMIPAYPGTGTGYNTRLQQKSGPGYFTNIAVWRKPPASQTRNDTIQFEKPGVAQFTGSPPQFVLTAPRTLTLLAEVVVDYGASQISDTPFTVSAPASFYENYTPTDTGIAVTDTQALGRYLAEASGISGTNSVYNGVLCDEWAAQLLSSVPSTFPSGPTVLRTENAPYLTDINGVVVWRREKTNYTF